MAVRSTRGGSRAGRIAVRSITAPKLQDSLGAFLLLSMQEHTSSMQADGRILLPRSMQEPLGSTQEHITLYALSDATRCNAGTQAGAITSMQAAYHITSTMPLLSDAGRGLDAGRRTHRCLQDPVWPNRDRRDDHRGYRVNPVVFLSSLHHVIGSSTITL